MSRHSNAFAGRIVFPAMIRADNARAVGGPGDSPERKFCSAVNAEIFPGVYAIARSAQDEVLAQHAHRFQFVFRQGKSPGNRKTLVQEERVVQSEVWRHRDVRPLNSELILSHPADSKKSPLLIRRI